MSFEWNKYLDLAKKLSLAVTDEASLRSAVSRSYYCAFNIALGRAKANSYRSPDDGSSHDLLWDLYGRNDDKKCKQLAVLGPRMKRRRVKADYRSTYEKLSDETLDAIADAEECIALIASLSNELPKDLPRHFSF
jgi:uncharacterized protein (UPF0332 family)